MKNLTVDSALKKLHTSEEQKTAPKFAAAWQMVRPFVLMLSGLLGRKIKPYINAVVAGIDKYVADQEDGGAEE